ncbi:MAG: twin-arginine translocation signal domain-containing protein [Verrucomicrobiota bacterium]
MSINRRDFVKTASAAGLGLFASNVLADNRTAPKNHKIGKQAIADRIAFGAWINDVRTEPLPFDSWPPVILDDIAEQSIIRTMDLQARSGYNMFDMFGLFAAWGWPVDIVSAVDKDRDARVRRIIKAAHRRGIKLVYGLGVYSWGFDKIIEHDPAVSGPNKHAMCASKEESWVWQKKVIDFILRYDFDGYHLEASDLGRCTCAACMKEWPVQATYYNNITARCADYIRQQAPDKYIAAITISWADWNKGFTEVDKNNLVELSKKVDSILDQGHHGLYIKQPERKAFVERLQCKFGTSGGFWVYPPFRCHRQRWFLPYTKKTGTHIKELYADGGRTTLYYQGPVTNPGSEVNIAFGGKMMSDVNRDVDEVLSEVLEDLYQPKSSASQKKLIQTFQLAEEAYFSNLDYDADGVHLKGLQAYPGPGELHIGFGIGLATGASAVPVYLLEPNLTDKGRAAYAKGLEACLKNICEIESQVAATERIQRLKSSIYHALDDVINIAYARETAKKA